MSKILKPNPKQIFLPKRFIKEEVDRLSRQEWDRADRYEHKKAQALKYIEERVPQCDLPLDKLLREVTRVFHDELYTDPDIKAAIERAMEARVNVPARIEAEPERDFEAMEDRPVEEWTDDDFRELEWNREEEKKS